MSTEFDAALPDSETITSCEMLLGYQFTDKKWLIKGLTHASIAQTRLQSNERMEFLGDAVLGAVVCDRLFALFPEDEEGQMTQMKSEVVSRSACAQLALSLGLDRFVLMGKGLHQSREIPLSVLAGVFESVVAAIYLDGGYQAAFQFISGKLDALIHHAAETAHIRNSKSQLQQLTQRIHGKTPTYELVGEAGPDHSKYFLVTALVGETSFPPAWGANKKEAEQKAALNALSVLQNQRLPYALEDFPGSAADWQAMQTLLAASATADSDTADSDTADSDTADSDTADSDTADSDRTDSDRTDSDRTDSDTAPAEELLTSQGEILRESPIPFPPETEPGEQAGADLSAVQSFVWKFVQNSVQANPKTDPETEPMAEPRDTPPDPAGRDTV